MIGDKERMHERLLESGYVFVASKGVYWNQDWGKAISCQWIDAHSTDDLLQEIGKRPNLAFTFVFNEVPPPSVIEQLRTLPMDYRASLAAVRRALKCEEGESTIARAEQLATDRTHADA